MTQQAPSINAAPPLPPIEAKPDVRLQQRYMTSLFADLEHTDHAPAGLVQSDDLWLADQPTSPLPPDLAELPELTMISEGPPFELFHNFGQNERNLGGNVAEQWVNASYVPLPILHIEEVLDTPLLPPPPRRLPCNHGVDEIDGRGELGDRVAEEFGQCARNEGEIQFEHKSVVYEAEGFSEGYDYTSPASSRPSTPLPCNAQQGWLTPFTYRNMTTGPTSSSPPSPASLMPPSPRPVWGTQRQLRFDDQPGAVPAPPTSCRDCRRFYLFTAMPEKNKKIWVVFYCHHEHPKARVSLELADIADENDEDGERADKIEIEIDHKLSWIAKGVVKDDKTGEDVAMVQHKWCFTCPNETFNGCVFTARLVEPSLGITTLLGGMSVISTTTQRDKRRPEVIQACSSDFERGLVDNFTNHPPSRRHFRNGKGQGQGHGQRQRKRVADRFLNDEFDLAIKQPEQ